MYVAPVFIWSVRTAVSTCALTLQEYHLIFSQSKTLRYMKTLSLRNEYFTHFTFPQFYLIPFYMKVIVLKSLSIFQFSI